MNISEALQAMVDGHRVCPVGSVPYRYFYVEDHKLYDHMGNHVKNLDFDFAMGHEWQIYEEPKWEPQGGCFYVNGYGEVTSFMYQIDEFGTARSTKKQAEAARDKMRMFNRLLAWLDEHNGEEFRLNIETDEYGRLNLTFLGVSNDTVEKLYTLMQEGRVEL